MSSDTLSLLVIMHFSGIGSLMSMLIFYACRCAFLDVLLNGHNRCF
jgi:hypothetical protein